MLGINGLNVLEQLRRPRLHDGDRAAQPGAISSRRRCSTSASSRPPRWWPCSSASSRSVWGCSGGSGSPGASLERYLESAHLSPPEGARGARQPRSAHRRRHPRVHHHHALVRAHVAQRRRFTIVAFSGVMWSISPLLFLVAVGVRGAGLGAHDRLRTSPGPAQLRPVRPRGQLPRRARARARERRVGRAPPARGTTLGPTPTPAGCARRRT